MDLNIILFIVITVIFAIIMGLKIRTRFKTKITQVHQIRPKDQKDFLKKLKGHCSDKCYVSFYSVTIVKELLKKTGFKKGTKFMHNNKELFKTDSKETPFIWEWKPKEEIYFCHFHPNEKINGKNHKDVQKYIDSVCITQKCDVKMVLDGLYETSRKSKR